MNSIMEKLTGNLNPSKTNANEVHEEVLDGFIQKFDDYPKVYRTVRVTF